MNSRNSLIVNHFLILASVLILLLIAEITYDINGILKNTPIKLFGGLVILTMIMVIISALNRLKKIHGKIEYSLFVITGTTIVFLSEIIYQAFRQFFMKGIPFNDRVFEYVSGLTASTLLGLIISFLVTFQLRTRKTAYLFLLIITMLICIYYLLKLFPAYTNG